MKTSICMLSLALTLISLPVLALDENCETILKLEENRYRQPTWHEIADYGGFTIESIKINGQSFRGEDDKWTEFPPTLSMDMLGLGAINERRKGIMLGRIKVNMFDCKEIGQEIIRSNNEDIKVMAYQYKISDEHVSSEVVIYFGEKDNLEYYSESKGSKGGVSKITIKYNGVEAPKLK